MQISIEELREKFEASMPAQQIRMSFNEYAMLYHLREGVRAAEIFANLYMSCSTYYRLKERIRKKLKANTFEGALIKAGEIVFSEKRR